MDISTPFFGSIKPDGKIITSGTNPIVSRVEVPAKEPGGWGGVMELRADIPILPHYLHDDPIPVPEPEPEIIIEKMLMLLKEDERICWKLGDYANSLLTDTRPGRATDGRLTRAYLAGRLQMSASKLEDLQKVASRFPAAIRDDIPPNLGIGHLRAIARRVDDLETALEWVNKASDEDWSVDKLADELGKTYQHNPKPPIETQRHVIPAANLPTLLKNLRGDCWEPRPVDVSEHDDYYILKVYK